MDIETVLAILASLGVGGIIGGYLQHLWSQKEKTESEIQRLNEDKYRTTLVYMRVMLKPKSLRHFKIANDSIYQLNTVDEIRAHARL